MRSTQCPAELTFRSGLTILNFMGTLRVYRGLIAWVVSVALVGNLAALMLCCVPRTAASDYPVDLLGPRDLHGSRYRDDVRKDLAPGSSAVCPLSTTPALAAIAVNLSTALERITPPPRQRPTFDFILTRPTSCVGWDSKAARLLFLPDELSVSRSFPIVRGRVQARKLWRVL